MHAPSQSTADAGWVDTDRSRREAFWTSFRRHPWRTVRGSRTRRRAPALSGPTPTGANEVLERLAELPLSVWSYGFDGAGVRHLGPMAQDFARAFGLGSSDRRIDMVDANGVTMAACQALYRRVVAVEAEVARLREQPVGRS